MICFHINQITQEIENFDSKIGDYNSSIYRTLSEIINKKDIARKEVLVKKG